MSIASNLTPLHGYKIRGLTKETQQANNALIDALQSPLDQAEKDLYQAKLESFLDTADNGWLEYWGGWLGLHRGNGQGDDTYRKALKAHVLHNRNTITALREALAKFLKTKVENIFIYEPYRDMMIWNSSRWNTYKFYPSTYYRYAVIDIQLDAAYNNVTSQIINLFRPAGVMWVITSLVNVLNDNAPIIDMSAQTFGFPFITEYTDYAGFVKRNSHYITPNVSKNWDIDNPFIYNDSLLNGGKKYFALSRAINGVSFLGLVDNNVEPDANQGYMSAYNLMNPLSTMEAGQLSTMDGMGVNYELSPTYKSYNLIDNSRTFNFPYSNKVWQNNPTDNTIKYENDGSVAIHYEPNQRKLAERDLIKSIWDVPLGSNKAYTFQQTDVITQPGTYVVRWRSKPINGSTAKHGRITVYDLSKGITLQNDGKDVFSQFELSDKRQQLIFTIPDKNNPWRVLFYNGDTTDGNGTVEYYDVALYRIDDINYGGPYFISPLTKLEEGKKYVWSIDARGSHVIGNLNYEGDSSAYKSNLALTEQWKRESTTFTYTGSTSSGALTSYFKLALDDPETDNYWYEIRNPKLAPYTGSKDDNIWTPSKSEAQRSTLLGVVDFYNYFLDDKPTGLSKKERVLNAVDASPIKDLVLRLEQSNYNPDEVKAYAYNFDLNIWVYQKSLTVTNKYQTFHLPFVSLNPYLNNNGLFFIKLVPKDTQTTISVDYYGFSYGSTQYGVTECYMPAQDGLGAWIKIDQASASDLKIPLTDFSHTDQTRMRIQFGFVTVLFFNQTPLNSMLDLGTIKPKMNTDIFYLDLDYELKDFGQIFLHLVPASGTAIDSELNYQYYKTGHVSLKLPKLNSATQVYLYSNVGGQAKNITVTQQSYHYNNLGANLLPATVSQGMNNVTANRDHSIRSETEPRDNGENTFHVAQGDPITIKIPVLDENKSCAFSVSVKGTGTLTTISNGDSTKTINMPLDSDYYLRPEAVFNKINSTTGIVLTITGAASAVDVKLPKLEVGTTSTNFSVD